MFLLLNLPIVFSLFFFKVQIELGGSKQGMFEFFLTATFKCFSACIANNVFLETV